MLRNAAMAMLNVALTVVLFVTVTADKLDDLLGKHQSYCGTNIHREIALSNSSSSGSPSNDTSYRIVGGTAADRFEFPWQVSLRRWSPKANRWFHTCGGALIDSSFILTAAHCTLGVNATADQFMVRLGEYDYSKREGDEVDVNVSMILSHSRFNLSTIDHDINLIKLAEPLQLNSTSKLVPICIGKQTTEDSRETDERGCYSTGWGRLKYEGEFPKVLQKVPVKWVEQETCQKAYEEHVNVTAGMICSGQLNAGTCSGDSGGPTQCLSTSPALTGNSDDTNLRWTLYGLTSWAVGCAEEKYPSVAARVAYYRAWIADTMEGNL